MFSAAGLVVPIRSQERGWDGATGWHNANPYPRILPARLTSLEWVPGLALVVPYPPELVQTQVKLDRPSRQVGTHRDPEVAIPQDGRVREVP